MLAVQKKYYQRGYQNFLSQVQRQYGLRNKNVPITSNQKKKNSQAYFYKKEMTSTNQNKDKGLVFINQGKINEASTRNPKKYK